MEKYVIRNICGDLFLTDETGFKKKIDTKNKINGEIFKGNSIKFFDGEVVECKVTNSSNLESIIELNLLESGVRNLLFCGRFNTRSSFIGFKESKNKKVKGKPLYLIENLNPLYPKFIISYGGKITGDIFVRFKFLNWDDKIPFGVIDDSGTILKYEESNFENIMMIYYGIDKRYKIETDEAPNNYESNIERRKIEDQFIFSVDPVGCEDIDDALSFRKDSNVISVGIYIAQPSYYLDIHDVISASDFMFSTIYNNKRRDLYGDKITEMASLKKGCLKPAYLTVFKYEVSSECKAKFLEIESYPVFISCSENFSYESVMESDNKCVIDLLNFTRLLTNDNKIDFHEIVAFWMKECNIYIGNKLMDMNMGQYVPYRINKINSNYDSLESLPSEVNERFKMKDYEKATYKYYDDGEPCYHQSLEAYYYVHFTSPIRRIVDTWIHYLVSYPKDLIEEFILNKLNLETVNKLDTNTSRYHRQVEYRNLINDLFVDETGTKVHKIDTNLWVYKIISFNEIEVYIEKLKIFKKINIFNAKFFDEYSVEEIRSDTIIKKLIFKKEGEGGPVEQIIEIGSKIETNISRNAGENIMSNRMIFPIYIIKIDL